MEKKEKDSVDINQVKARVEKLKREFENQRLTMALGLKMKEAFFDKGKEATAAVASS